MAKLKVSATVDPERLERAKHLTGCRNVSEVIDRGLAALIDRELERVHSEGYVQVPQGDEAVAIVGPTVWSEVPWDED
ncbi:MAG: hypothetical protein ACR2HY_11230 [Acidimicrobiales bacterium]